MSSRQSLESEEVIVHSLEIQRGLGRVEGKLDQIIYGMNSHEERDTDRFKEVNIRLDSQDVRQSKIEKKIWLWSGGLAVIAFIISHFPFNILIGK